MKLRSGIKLIREIDGHGAPIADKGRFDAVMKFYLNHGDPLQLKTVLQDPVPYILESASGPQVAWHEPRMENSHIVFERNSWLARQGDMLPGIYYSFLGMKLGGYRKVAIPPHLYAHSMYQVLGIEKDSVIKLELFMLAIHNYGDHQGELKTNT